MDQAVESAREAFPAWKALSRIRRGKYLNACGQLVKRDVEGLLRLLSQESG